MKLRSILCVLAIICISIISCSKQKNVAVTSEQSQPEINANYLINLDSCVSVSILKDVEDEILLSKEDVTIVLAYINSGIYNEERNDSGIKFKMVSPDYTFLVEFKDGKKEMVQYWVEPALVFYDAKWYDPISAANIQDTLAKYSK